MIRGPVLPQVRASLWSLVKPRLETIESGLSLVLEGFDCSEGQLGVIEGLARDAMGAPVAVMLAVDGDSLLPARVLAAGNFLQRVGDGLMRAVPEAHLRPGRRGRLIVVGTEASAALLAQVCRLPIGGLHVCSLEPFRLAGSERFAVRWLPVAASVDLAGVSDASLTQPAAEPAVQVEDVFEVSAERSDLWQTLCELCERIDPAVQVHGDRFLRRVLWSGQLLGEVRIVEGELLASAVTGVVRELRDKRDVRLFGDQLLRAFARLSGLAEQQAAWSSERRSTPATQSPPPAAQSQPTRHSTNGKESNRTGSLRSTLAAAKLSPEEYSALGDPALSAGERVGGVRSPN